MKIFRGNDLYKALNSFSNLHPMESCWIIKSINSTYYLRDYFETKIDSNDKLFVSKLDDWASLNLTQTEVKQLKQSQRRSGYSVPFIWWALQD